MSESFPPPPAYEAIGKTSIPKTSDVKWQAWYKKLIALEFDQDQATEYARLFNANEIEIDMIPELNDDILKSIGIDKAGHRIRVLRLQNKTLTSTQTSAVTVVAPAVDTPRCAWHPRVAANEKCRKCKRLVCLRCHRATPNDGCVNYYCQNCHDDCTVL